MGKEIGSEREREREQKSALKAIQPWSIKLNNHIHRIAGIMTQKRSSMKIGLIHLIYNGKKRKLAFKAAGMKHQT
jgi:hypothetical protein